MRKFLLTAGVLLSTLSMAQNITFQDSKFKQALIDAGVDTNRDGQISTSEAKAVTTLNLYNKSIKVIRSSEIMHFSNLQSLNISKNDITYLNLQNNRNLKRFEYIATYDAVIDANDLPKLEFISCNQSMNIRNVPNLKELHLIEAHGEVGLNGDKESWDLSAYPKLSNVSIKTYFDYWDQMFEPFFKVKRIKIDNPELKKIEIEGAELEFLDLSKAPKLKSLSVVYSPLKVLNVANGNNANFEKFSVSGGGFMNVKCIQVDRGFYPPNSWNKPDNASFNADCGCDHPLFISDSKFFEIVKTHDKDNNGVMCPKEADKITSVVAINKDIYSLNGIEGMKNLNSFILRKTKVKEVDLSKNTELKIVSISGDDVKYINTKNLSKLEDLSVSDIPSYGRFEFITGDPSDYPKLTDLTIGKIDFEWLDDQGIEEAAKDLSEFPRLENVVFSGYVFMSSQYDDDVWNIQGAKQIKSLRLSNVGFGDLDINKLTKLEKLYVYDDKYMTSIKLDKAVKLREVEITGNKKLTSLDLSKNTDLGKDVPGSLFVATRPGRVTLKNNKLKSLNLANGVNYQITNVDLTGNPDLKCVKIDASFIPPATWTKDNQTAFSNNCGMGVAEVADQAFRMYPNPVQDVLHIDSDKTVESVTVYDANGRLVFTKEGVNQLNVSALHAGVYIVQVVVDGQKVSKKIIKK